MKIALIPIDNRPVCYNLAKEIAGIDEDLELFLPEKSLLGSLKSTADVDGILNWLEGLESVDAIVVSLDTIAYGGLISSRKCENSTEEIKSRLQRFRDICGYKCGDKHNRVYAFSSIMRISNNNVNEEEKEYWDRYGKMIFEYSYNFHKDGIEIGGIPQEILSDYFATRQRNFQINKMYLDWVEQDIFDTLVFSKDDCSQYGLNVLESEILGRIVKEKNLFDEKKQVSSMDIPSKSVFIKTGADEIPLTLLARAVVDFNKELDEDKTQPKISLKLFVPEYSYLISNYEDISVENSAKAQIELAGCEVCEEEHADLVLMMNNFEEHQGEIVMGVKTKPFMGKFDLPKKPYMIADVRFANGSDNKFVQQLLKKKLGSEFYGYSAWNTSANTLGSLICAAVVKFFAKKYNQEAFNRLQMVRFLDDWAYQANVRQALKLIHPKGSPRLDIRRLKSMMLPYEKKLSKIFGVKSKIKYGFPWRRFFEVSVVIVDK